MYILILAQGSLFLGLFYFLNIKSVTIPLYYSQNFAGQRWHLVIMRAMFTFTRCLEYWQFSKILHRFCALCVCVLQVVCFIVSNLLQARPEIMTRPWRRFMPPPLFVLSTHCLLVWEVLLSSQWGILLSIHILELWLWGAFGQTFYLVGLRFFALLFFNLD